MGSLRSRSSSLQAPLPLRGARFVPSRLIVSLTSAHLRAPSASATSAAPSSTATASSIPASSSSTAATSSAVAPSSTAAQPQPTGSSSLNLARNATASASTWSDATSQTPDKAVDGVVSGYKEDGSGDYTKEVRDSLALPLWVLQSPADTHLDAVGLGSRGRRRHLRADLVEPRDGHPLRPLRSAQPQRPGALSSLSYAFEFPVLMLYLHRSPRRTFSSRTSRPSPCRPWPTTVRRQPSTLPRRPSRRRSSTSRAPATRRPTSASQRFRSSTSQRTGWPRGELSFPGSLPARRFTPSLHAARRLLPPSTHRRHHRAS